MKKVPGPSCRGVLAGLPHTTGLGFQTGHPDRRVLVENMFQRVGGLFDPK